MPIEPVSPFQLTVVTFLAWEEAPNDVERISAFREAMRTFLTPEIRERVTGQWKHGSLASDVQTHRTAPEEVRATGAFNSYLTELGELMAEGWTMVDELSMESDWNGDQHPLVVLSRLATSEEAEVFCAEEAAERTAAERSELERKMAEYEGLKAFFDKGRVG